MHVLLTLWHFYVFGIFCCSISHSTSHAPIFYAKKMIARRLRRFFEVNLFYSLCAGSEKAPPRRVGQRGEASPVGGPLWFIAGPLMLASIGSMPTRTQPSKKRTPVSEGALFRATCRVIKGRSVRDSRVLQDLPRSGHLIDLVNGADEDCRPSQILVFRMFKEPRNRGAFNQKSISSCAWHRAA